MRNPDVVSTSLKSPKWVFKGNDGGDRGSGGSVLVGMCMNEHRGMEFLITRCEYPAFGQQIVAITRPRATG